MEVGRLKTYLRTAIDELEKSDLSKDLQDRLDFFRDIKISWKNILFSMHGMEVLVTNHTHKHTNAHTHTHTHKQTYTHTPSHPPTQPRTWTPAHMHTYVHIYTHIYTPACTHTNAPAHPLTNSPTNIHTLRRQKVAQSAQTV